MNFSGWMTFFTCSTTGDSWTASRTSGPGWTHLLNMMFSSTKLRKPTSITGIMLMRRGRILQPASHQPLSRGHPTRNHTLACPQNLGKPPNLNHHPLPTNLHQIHHPCHGLWPRTMTPTRTCLQSLDLMANSFWQRRNTARSSVFAFTMVSKMTVHHPTSINQTPLRSTNQLAPPTHLNPRAVQHKPKPRNQTPSRWLLPMPWIFSTQPCWHARPLWSQ